jgi:hypothetical protein
MAGGRARSHKKPEKHSSHGSYWIPEDKKVSKEFSKNNNLCYICSEPPHSGAAGGSGSGEMERRNAFEMFRSQPGTRVGGKKDFSIWIRRNHLKGPIRQRKNKEMQAFSLAFPWFYLDLFGRHSPSG